MKSRFVGKDKAFEFSLLIVGLHKELKKNKEFEISNQLLKSATSIGANIEEASAAVSKKDFINKLSIASKEAREARYWLEILNESRLIEYDYSSLIDLSDQLIRIITASVKTAQSKLNSNNGG